MCYNTNKISTYGFQDLEKKEDIFDLLEVRKKKILLVLRTGMQN